MDIVLRAQPVAKSTDILMPLFCVPFCLLTRLEPLFHVMKLSFKSCVLWVALHLFTYFPHLSSPWHRWHSFPFTSFIIWTCVPETHRKVNTFLHVTCTSFGTWRTGWLNIVAQSVQMQEIQSSVSNKECSGWANWVHLLGLLLLLFDHLFNFNFFCWLQYSSKVSYLPNESFSNVSADIAQDLRRMLNSDELSRPSALDFTSKISHLSILFYVQLPTSLLLLCSFMPFLSVSIFSGVNVSWMH